MRYLAILMVMLGCGGGGGDDGEPICRADEPIYGAEQTPLQRTHAYPKVSYGNSSPANCCDGFYYKVDHVNNGSNNGRDLAGLEAEVSVFDQDGALLDRRTVPDSFRNNYIDKENVAVHSILSLTMPEIEKEFGVKTVPCGFRVEIELRATQRGRIAGSSPLVDLTPPEKLDTAIFQCSTDLCDDKQSALPGIGPSTQGGSDLAFAIEDAEALGISLLAYADLAYGISIEESDIGWKRGFVRGDVNSDALVDWQDHEALLAVLNDGTLGNCACAEASDVYDDGVLDAKDASYLVELIHAYENASEDDAVESDEDDDDLTCVFPADDVVCDPTSDTSLGESAR